MVVKLYLGLYLLLLYLFTRSGNEWKCKFCTGPVLKPFTLTINWYYILNSNSWILAIQITWIQSFQQNFSKRLHFACLKHSDFQPIRVLKRLVARVVQMKGALETYYIVITCRYNYIPYKDFAKDHIYKNNSLR